VSTATLYELVFAEGILVGLYVGRLVYRVWMWRS
jgi:hypothetical protein